MKRTIRTVLKSPWFWIIAAGYALRIMVMPITGQHDVMFMPWMTRYINLGHFNLYAFLQEEFGELATQRPMVWAPYPYGFYLLTAGWLEFLEKIGLVDLVSWSTVWQVSHPARYVFLLKAAYLPFDLLIGYILYRTCGRIGMALWAWSPTAIYTPFLMGQNDIYATAFAVAGTYAASKAKPSSTQEPSSSVWFSDKWAILACVFLGIGSTFKIYPLLLLLPLVLIVEKRLWQRVGLFCIGCVIPVAISLPFLATPAFVNGVLLNPEGTGILREIQLFGVSVSPFLLGYIVLFGYLLIHPAKRSPWMGWFASLLLIALLFLWVPVPFYWLIWITPLLIGAIGRSPRLVLAWVLLQLAFALTLTTQHRELGVALPVHLAPMLQLPNLPTALSLTHPVLHQIFIALLPIVNGFWVAALVVIIWYSARGLAQGQRGQSGTLDMQVKWWPVVVVPTAVMLSVLGINLHFSRDLASDSNWYRWQNQTLTAGDYVLQELGVERREVTGIRLRLAEADPPAIIKVCLYQDGDMSREPLKCASESTAEQVENQVLYFVFDRAVVLEADDTPTAKIQIEGSGASTVILPYTTATEHSLQFGETAVNGSLDISATSSLTIAGVFSDLVVANILGDGWLLVAIGVVSALVITLLGVLLWKL